MCGFLAEFTYTGTNVTEVSTFETLLGLSTHRGPDFTETVRGDYYQLGFNRLAILDVSVQGNQPKLSPSGRYHVVFNGELYNYKALEATYGFKNLLSTSDTEVLVHLLDELGVEGTVPLLNGMFSIAIVDTKVHALYLIRDFAGIKPLFYGKSSEGIVVASQFNQVFRHEWFCNRLELRPELIKAYMGFGYMPSPHTIYKDVYQVDPGTYLKFDRAGNEECIVYERFSSDLDTLTLNETLQKTRLEHTLKESVKRQLVSDVPIASFLSGGIDSPLITAMAKAERSNISAFTMAVSDEALDERVDAANYAKHIAVHHVVTEVSETELLSSIDAHFTYMSEPFGDYSSIPTFMVTQQAKTSYTVMLSGDGGDELFFGYPRMLDVVKKRYWFAIPYRLRRPILRLTNKLQLTRTWAPYHYKTIGDWVHEKHTHIFKTQLDGFFNEPIKDVLSAHYRFKGVFNTRKLLLWLRSNEFYAHLQRVLTKVDCMSMANSIEVRVPFLDKEVVRLAYGFYPERFKTASDLKGVLKSLLKDYYPSSIIYNQKKGFTVPIADWLKTHLYQDVQQVVFEQPIYGNSYLDSEAVRAYVADFYNGKHDSAWGVWHVYAWQKWAIKEQLL